MRTTSLLVLWAAVVSGCAASPPPAAAPPGAPPRAARAEPHAPETPGMALPGDADKVPAAPAECQAFATRSAPAAACDEKNALGLLAAALAKADAAERDTALTALEPCTQLPAGLARAMRAELAPVACGDVLVESFLAKPPPGIEPELRDALMGLGFAARASRLVREPPQLAPPHGKARVNQFMAGPLKHWIEGQAKAIHSVSLHGSNLEGYGKAVVAVEAGLADLRFVEVARAAPIPEEIAKDRELKDAYLGALEQALEPRKLRGRDAALVGLKKLAEAGVIHDPRVVRARKLLSEAYAGRRIDALDSLLIPELPAVGPKTDLERLATLLPTPYADRVFAAHKPSDPGLLRALLERGLPKSARQKLEADKALPTESRRLLSRALFALGQRYWRATDFAAAAAVLATARPAGGLKDESDLISALTKALESGPKDAAEMMLRGPHLPKGVGDVSRLDELGKGKGPGAGLALFDAARLLEIARPAGADAAYFSAIAQRYTQAAAALTDAAKKADAADRAKAARDTAAALSRGP
ncbi:MAG: hypothetical protein IT375_31570 [Polyangiaceae bacterium]|nr:hypothetical protein [Polyangiaceae bacterium]